MTISLITGGSRGLGKAMALALADKGHDIILTYRSRRDEAQAVVDAVANKGRRAVALPLDVSDSAGFDGFVAEVRRVLAETWRRDTFTALVNNAGIGIMKGYADTTEADFDTLMKIHVKAPYFLTQKLLPMIADGGSILNVSSGLTRFSMPGFSAYAAMKGAVEVLTHFQAKELGPRGIQVNTLAPGAIETDFGGGLVRDTPEVNAAISDQTAFGRVGQPDDIGNVVAMLLSPESRWINGQRIEAAGGVYL